jgi:nitroreductase
MEPGGEPRERGTATLALSPDELLATTRSVRLRLDLARPVALELVEECLLLAQQAPTGGNQQTWAFVVVTDAEKRRELGRLYKQGWDAYREAIAARNAAAEVTRPSRDVLRVYRSAQHLADHMGAVPVLVIPCIQGRTEGLANEAQAAQFGSILPATWSFMLAARARGLGTCWTTLHLLHEREAAELLGIPFDDVMQVAMIPVAHAIGKAFKPAPRKPLETMVRWESWS